MASVSSNSPRGRTLQPGGEFEDARTKGVDSSVVPGARRFARSGVFREVGQLEALVDEDRAALAHILVVLHADDGLGIRPRGREAR